MGGGLMQLVAYGAQDIYLTGNPQITFFKVVYRRHTNFSMEAIEQTFNGTVGSGNKVTATISRNGDLVSRMYLESSIKYATAASSDVNANPGSAFISEAEIEIGGQRIDRHYGHWLEVWAELTEPNSNGAITTLADGSGTTVATGTKLVSGTKFQNMSLMGGVKGLAAGSITADTDTQLFFTPLQFWFCRNPGLALPLIALQYHEVKVSITFAGNNTATSTFSTDTLTSRLYVDYIYLDTDERRRFAQVSHEYLIEQLQYTSSASNTNHTLNFNHPVKELIWTGATTAAGSVTEGPSTPTALTAGSTYQLKLNGHERMAARDRLYYTRAQVWQHHTGFGGIVPGTAGAGDTIAVYSFALKPEEHQPSGTCNFSRIDNAKLVCSVAEELNIYAVNYNVLRIMSGMGGLAYSN